MRDFGRWVNVGESSPRFAAGRSVFEPGPVRGYQDEGGELAVAGWGCLES